MIKISRHYQKDGKIAINKDLAAGIKNLLLVLATGCGKTFTAVDIIREFSKRLWITHTEELLEQSGIAMLQEYYPHLNVRDIIQSYGGLTDYIRYIQANPLFADLSENEIIKGVSVIKADLFGLEGDIVLASAQTLHRRLDKISANLFDVVVCDEAHLFAAPTFVKSLNYFDPKLLLGLTATPHRADGMLMGDIFDKISYQYNIGDAIRDGYLCELDAIQVQTHLNLDGVRTTAGELNQKDLHDTVDTPVRNKLLVQKYKQYAEGKQNLVFCVDVEHAQNVCEEFKEAGYRAEFIVGDTDLTPDRKKVIERFKSGETQILTNVMVLTAGFDHPNVGCITMACPTKSLTKFMQQVGRGTRTLPGVIDPYDTADGRRVAIKTSAKPVCKILDIVDTTTRHRLVNTFELDKEVPINERVFTTEEKKILIFEARKRQFEASRKEDQRVSLLDIPTVKYSDSIRMREDATEAQLNVLRDKGYDTANINYTKGMANQIISDLPASAKQIGWLKWKGYDTSKPGITYGEFQIAKKEVEKREALALQKTKSVSDGPISDIF